MTTATPNEVTTMRQQRQSHASSLFLLELILALLIFSVAGAVCVRFFVKAHTILGAAMVFFFKKDISDTVQKVFLGFAAGVMIAMNTINVVVIASAGAGTPGY